MSAIGREQILQHRGQDLYDNDGDKIGSIEEIYLDADTNEPEWALVNTGLFGTKSTFVPLREATDDGGSLRVPYEKGQVKDDLDNLTASFGDGIGRVALQGMPERIVRCQEVPRSLLCQWLSGADRKAVGVIGPVNADRRAELPGEV